MYTSPRDLGDQIHTRNGGVEVDAARCTPTPFAWVSSHSTRGWSRRRWSSTPAVLGLGQLPARARRPGPPRPGAGAPRRARAADRCPRRGRRAPRPPPRARAALRLPQPGGAARASGSSPRSSSACETTARIAIALSADPSATSTPAPIRSAAATTDASSGSTSSRPPRPPRRAPDRPDGAIEVPLERARQSSAASSRCHESPIDLRQRRRVRISAGRGRVERNALRR